MYVGGYIFLGRRKQKCISIISSKFELTLIKQLIFHFSKNNLHYMYIKQNETPSFTFITSTLPLDIHRET